MITKLTADNASRYYGPAFELINQALETAGNPLRIHSIEDYFNNLYSDIIPLLVNQKENANGVIEGIRGGYLLLMPADEEIFEIDANTRTITVPAKIKKNGIGVYGDHRAEMIVLAIDRYFDNQDLLQTKVAINWNFTPAGGKSEDQVHSVAAFAPNADLNPEKVTFGFIIDKTMTKGKGTLTFSVTFYTDDSNVINYSLNTLTATLNINETLTLEKPEIIENDIDNYLNRFANSVYQDNTISPVGVPVWKSGNKDSNGNYSGLEEFAYFTTEEDLRNVYKGVVIKAYAVTNPSTAEVTYKWTEAPLNSNIDMGRDFNTVNKPSDYIEIELPTQDNGEIYYIKDEIGNIDTLHPLTYNEAKNKEAEFNNQDDMEYLPITIKKLDNVLEDLNEENSQFNQDNIILDVHGNIVRVVSREELRTFASTDPNQGEAQWIGFDIDTGFNSIIGINWNGYPLDENDIEEANSLNLGNGHIVFWAKANELQNIPRTIILTKEGYKSTQFSVYYDGIDNEQFEDNIATPIINISERPIFVVRGSSYYATAAGNYQVSAQARISAGDNYEKVLEGANLKVNTDYYLKDNNGNIDKYNPVRNELAVAAQEAGKELYVCTSAARNSDIVDSSVLVIPPAVQPVVNLQVGSEYVFEANGLISYDNDPLYDNYVYIDDTQIPTLIATVTINSNSLEDSKGAFAVELLKTDDEGHVPVITKDDIENNNYNFVRLPDDGKFIFQPEEGEGNYLVRAINRRNGTYSISDVENAQTIKTSFVAPSSNKITVSGAIWDYDEERPITGYQEVIIDGEKPDNHRIDLEIRENIHERYTFNIVNNTFYDPNKYDVENIVNAYQIEEVNYDEETDTIIPRDNSDIRYEQFGEEDIRDITINPDGTITFDINFDPGYYRIKIITHYHGTSCISYSDIFGIVLH